MKILVLSHISEMLGGAERSMLDVFDHWYQKYNVEPEFILREPIKSLAGELQKRGWKYYPLKYTFWSDGNPPKEIEDIVYNARQNQNAVKEIENIIVKTKPDIVMTNSIVCPWAAFAAYVTNVPHVWFVREYGDLDHGRVYEIGRQKTYHDVDNLSALVVANSNTLADYLKHYINNKKITALYNPFSLQEIQQRAAQKVSNPFSNNDALKLVITGNLAPSKGQHEVIEAVAELNKENNNVELCVIGRSGDPEYFKSIEGFVNKNGITNKIHFVGYQTNPLAFVSQADVCIMASRKEAFGRVTFEYLALGKPVVGADSGATPEMVLTGANGYLYEQGNVNSLVESLSHYLKERQLIIKHGAASKKKATAMMNGQFNVDALYKKVANLVNVKISSSKTPINYLQYWNNLFMGNKRGGTMNSSSIRRRIKRKIRLKVKAVYIRVRSLKTRMTGR